MVSGSVEKVPPTELEYCWAFVKTRAHPSHDLKVEKRHLKAQSDLTKSVDYKVALLLELWLETKDLNEGKVLQAKQAILNDLQEEIESICQIDYQAADHQASSKASSNDCPENKCPECPLLPTYCADEINQIKPDQSSSIKEKAFEYLVSNFKSVNYEKQEKINFKEEQFTQGGALKK